MQLGEQWGRRFGAAPQEWLQFPTEHGHTVVRRRDILRVTDLEGQKSSRLVFLTGDTSERQTWHIDLTIPASEVYAILAGKSEEA